MSRKYSQEEIWSPYPPFIPTKLARSRQEILEDSADWINEVVEKVKESGELPQKDIRFTHILMSNLIRVDYFTATNIYYDAVTDLRVILMKKYGISLRTIPFRRYAKNEHGGYAVETRGQFTYVSQLLDKMVSYGARASAYITQIEAQQLEIQDPQLKARIQRIRPQLLGLDLSLGTSRIKIGEKKV